MANWISQQKGKILKPYNKITTEPPVNGILTSEANKLWRAKIFINRATSGLPKDDAVLTSKDSVPNRVKAHDSFFERNPKLNPTANRETKENFRNLIKEGYFNKQKFEKDGSYDGRNDEIIISRQPLARHQGLQFLESSSNNQVIIYNLTSNGSYSYLVLQNRPPEVEFRGETSWARISSMGRNTPMYHYTGAEDILQFNISWFCSDPNNPAEVISKCRLLEAWTKANGYLAGPPILKIQWGKSGIFDEHKYILTSATYTLKNFQSGHMDRREKKQQYVDTKLFPMVATQELIFKRVSGYNLGYEDFVTEKDLYKTKGIYK